MAAPAHAVTLARKVAYWLDQRYLDPILGFVLPEVGDLVTTVFGLYVVIVAWREGVPVPRLGRMLTNLAIDALAGAVPVLGDVFDFVFKANTKNLALLEAHLQQPEATTHKDWLVLVGAAFALLVACAIPVVILVTFVRWLTAHA